MTATGTLDEMMPSKSTACSETLNVDFRDCLRPPQMCDDPDIGAIELLNVLASFRKFGFWRLNPDTMRSSWSEDIYAIYGMEHTPGEVDRKYAINRYHREDRPYISQLMKDAVDSKSGFQFVLRLKAGRGSYKLVQSVGKYRELSNGSRELYGVFSELLPATRMIGAAV